MSKKKISWPIQWAHIGNRNNKNPYKLGQILLATNPNKDVDYIPCFPAELKPGIEPPTKVNVGTEIAFCGLTKFHNGSTLLKFLAPKDWYSHSSVLLASKRSSLEDFRNYSTYVYIGSGFMKNLMDPIMTTSKLRGKKKSRRSGKTKRALRKRVVK